MDANTKRLQDLIAKLFIARTDVKAYQAGPGRFHGQYFTHTVGPRENPTYLPWDRNALIAHIAGQTTYGHYLLNTDNTCKLFAFDIDIKKLDETNVENSAWLPSLPMPTLDAEGWNSERSWDAWLQSFTWRDGRLAWQDRRDPARDYIKGAMRSLAATLERVIIEELQIPTAIAYTGSKGLHVYGFTGSMPAAEVREAAMLVIEALPIVPTRGKMIYEWDSPLERAHEDHKIFTIEVFPKQDEISASGGFGNLMRLPLGKNQKSNDPTFFVKTIDTPLGSLLPTPAEPLLESILEKMK